MTQERSARLTALIKRMPKDIREEFERMEAELAAANKKLNALDEASFSSAVGIIDHEYMSGGMRTVHRPLPANRPIRFYRRDQTQKQREGSECYIEFCFPRQEDPRDGKGLLIVEARTGFGGLVVRPNAINVVEIILEIRR